MQVLGHGSLNCHMSNWVILLARGNIVYPHPHPQTKKTIHLVKAKNRQSLSLCISSLLVSTLSTQAFHHRVRGVAVPQRLPVPHPARLAPRTPREPLQGETVCINTGMQHTAHSHFPGITALKREAPQWATYMPSV